MRDAQGLRAGDFMSGKEGQGVLYLYFFYDGWGI